MSKFRALEKARHRINKKLSPVKHVSSTINYNSITIGRVIDTNDPQENGRIRVFVPAFGDQDNYEVDQIPWALDGTGNKGSTNRIARGISTSGEAIYSTGQVAYGMNNIPKIGANAIVFCLDGNPNTRVWMGTIAGQFLNATLPHGRYTGTAGSFKGPLSSNNTPLEPLYSNQQTAFDVPSVSHNYEWETRAVDFQAAAVPKQIKNQIAGTDTTNTNGYAQSRDQLAEKGELDSQVYSWNTPGFHAISMDDRINNQRVRIRTTNGTQIILDDTNERIYINTALGNNWIELDQTGNIDVYSAKRISFTSDMDINFTAGGTFRVQANNGIYLNANGTGGVVGIEANGDVNVFGNQNIRMHANQQLNCDANQDINLKTNQNIRTFSSQQTLISSGQNMSLASNQNVNIQSGSQMNLLSGSSLNITSGAILNLSGGSGLYETAPVIHQNGPVAQPAQPATDSNASPSNAQISLVPNRIPSHEPWARVISTNPTTNTTYTPEFTYTNPNVDKVEDGQSLERNPYWRR